MKIPSAEKQIGGFIRSMFLIHDNLSSSVGGVKVSMVAFQAVDPGSIPGRRIFIFFIYFFFSTSYAVIMPPVKVCQSKLQIIDLYN